jgi:DNA-binding NarL/FixJ family response regulator
VHKPFVLLADDNEGTRTLITALLQNEFTLDHATNGQEAIDKRKSRQYAAILVDLLMPGVDGYAVLDHLTAERPELLSRVLVVTAAITTREMERVHRYDICGVIAKPFEVDALVTAVRRCADLPAEPFLRGPLLTGGVLLLLADLVRRGV